MVRREVEKRLGSAYPKQVRSEIMQFGITQFCALRDNAVRDRASMLVAGVSVHREVVHARLDSALQREERGRRARRRRKNTDAGSRRERSRSFWTGPILVPARPAPKCSRAGLV